MAFVARIDTDMNVAAFGIWAEARPDDERWELLDGEPVMMAPPSARHSAS